MHYPEPSTTVGWDLGVRWDGVWGWDGMGWGEHQIAEQRPQMHSEGICENNPVFPPCLGVQIRTTSGVTPNSPLLPVWAAVRSQRAECRKAAAIPHQELQPKLCLLESISMGGARGQGRGRKLPPAPIPCVFLWG